MAVATKLGEHLRTALGAALVFGLCQVVVECVIIAARLRHFVLSPQVFFGAQTYDFCVKLLLWCPATAEWLRGGALDRFLPVGFAAKLWLAAGLVLPNLIVCAVLGLAVGAARAGLRRPARIGPVIAAISACGLAVHLISWAIGVRIPMGWTLRSVTRNAARVFVWEGVFLGLIVLALTAGMAVLLSRLGAGARWAVSLAFAGAIAVAALAGGTSTTPPPQARARQPADSLGRAGERSVDSVILISIDSLRADRLGCYGNPRDTSPTLDRLAREGVRFDNAVSTTSWTLPSHMSLLTGRDVLSHGVIAETDQLPAGIPTLAQVLREAGRATAGIVSAPLLDSRFGFDRGFDLYDDQTIPAPTSFDALRDEPAPVVERLAVDWLREHAERPFFLFLHFWDVHYDYIPPPPYDTLFDPNYAGSMSGRDFFHDTAVNRRIAARDLEHIIALYDGEIRWVDDHIGRILSVVDGLGIAARTAIIVTADHGDEFFEHGFKGHGRTLYREVMQVPLIVRAPTAKPGTVVDAAVSLSDIMPTVLELAGLEIPPGMDGVSVSPALRGGGLDRQGGVVSWLCSLKQRTNCQAMLLSAAGTLIHRFQPLRIEFFTPQDLAQRQNLAWSNGWPRGQLAELQVRLDGQWQAYRALGARQGTVDMDKATLERLRQLGYVD